MTDSVDLPERLSLMTRFRPLFKVMDIRYLWHATGPWASGPVVITCCGEPFAFIGCLHIRCLAYFSGHSSPREYSQSFLTDLEDFRQRSHMVHWTSKLEKVAIICFDTLACKHIKSHADMCECSTVLSKR